MAIYLTRERELGRTVIMVEIDDSVREMFDNAAGGNDQIDAYELKDVLAENFQIEFPFDGFSVDVCRSMVAMFDSDITGMLDLEEFAMLWNHLTQWLEQFSSIDVDGNGYIDKENLQDVMENIDLSINEDTANVLSVRYSNREGHVDFGDYVSCVVRLKNMTESFKEKNEGDEATFAVYEYVHLGLYS